MPHNPYETPRSDVQQNEALPERPVRGILIGLLIDLGDLFTLLGLSVLTVGATLLGGAMALRGRS